MITDDEPRARHLVTEDLFAAIIADDLLTFCVDDAIKALRRPRMICICADFRPGDRDNDAAFTRCQNCRGWMSDERLACSAP